MFPSKYQWAGNITELNKKYPKYSSQVRGIFDSVIIDSI